VDYNEIETPKNELKRRQILWVISELTVYVSFSIDKILTPLSGCEPSLGADIKVEDI